MRGLVSQAYAGAALAPLQQAMAAAEAAVGAQQTARPQLDAVLDPSWVAAFIKRVVFVF